jgi:hypothetical protein
LIAGNWLGDSSTVDSNAEVFEVDFDGREAFVSSAWRHPAIQKPIAKTTTKDESTSTRTFGRDRFVSSILIDGLVGLTAQQRRHLTRAPTTDHWAVPIFP